MIPNFPNFKHVEIKDKPDVEKFTHSFKPYSDFNFISLFAWDTNNQRKIAIPNLPAYHFLFCQIIED